MQNLWVLQDFVIGVRVVYDGDWGAQVPSNGSKQDGSTHWRPPGEKIELLGWHLLVLWSLSIRSDPFSGTALLEGWSCSRWHIALLTQKSSSLMSSLWCGALQQNFRPSVRCGFPGILYTACVILVSKGKVATSIIIHACIHTYLCITLHYVRYITIHCITLDYQHTLYIHIHYTHYIHYNTTYTTDLT